ncbi:PD-(D/E)XK nuclease family protein [Pseudomonas putida]|uniref:PD-(D/E)XK nuclease family protein n=1 Tax=Pseudomonas putida TaxID=303 RepID=UPI0018AAF5A3|nr:PD-(D/E)XK nuclease family protein [Pseudomonas putida]MBF8767966.1 PD-(D/E)XK nuclease family protein [Pseudomonas putida]
MDKAQLLLNQAGSLVRETEAKLAASGELFNIFSITRIERAEVNTHSAMIAELLNPKGRHGQGECFLELFLATMGFDYEGSISDAKVNKEQFFAGYGRVDVVIHHRITTTMRPFSQPRLRHSNSPDSGRNDAAPTVQQSSSISLGVSPCPPREANDCGRMADAAHLSSRHTSFCLIQFSHT